MSALSQREAVLARRRHDLLARSQAQRTQILSALGGMRSGLAGADRVFRLARWLHRRAAWVGLAGAAVLMFKRPRGVLKLAGKAWSLWRGWRMLGL